MPIDRQALVHELQSFIAIAQSGSNAAGQITATPSLPGQIQQRAAAIEPILDRYVLGWKQTPRRPMESAWGIHTRSANAAIGKIENEERIAAMLGDDGPQMSANGLDPIVWDAARSLWASEHYRQAVSAAAIAVNAMAQQKLGVRDRSEHDLIANAFSRDAPKAGRPRLRIWTNDGGDTYINMQDGAASFTRGVYMALRNPSQHEPLDELTEQEGLEQLAAFSILARWIGTAAIERADA